MLVPSPPSVLVKEFVFEQAPFRQCHASTIAQSQGQLVCAWFGGTAEGENDVGIWLSRYVHGKWLSPVEVAKGASEPCWNPVLFQPRGGPLMLFYKVGPDPRHWWGMLMNSTDGGKTWGKPHRLPPGILGPIKNQPVQLSDGSILCPSSTEDHGWQVHFERTIDSGETWQRIGPVNDGKSIEAIQPSILFLGGEKLLAIGRTQQNRIFAINSEDDGQTWGPMRLGELPNPNSGTDALTLKDGRQLIVYNREIVPEGKWTADRSRLDVAISPDGEHWTEVAVLENEPGNEFSYPTVMQASDGLVHIVYTWKRKRIAHVVIDPSKINDARAKPTR